MTAAAGCVGRSACDDEWCPWLPAGVRTDDWTGDVADCCFWDDVDGDGVSTLWRKLSSGKSWSCGIWWRRLACSVLHSGSYVRRESSERRLAV